MVEVRKLICFIVFLFFISSCSLISSKRKVSCPYYDLSLTFECNGNEQTCQILCENIVHDLELVDEIKAEIMRRQKEALDAMQSPGFHHSI